MGAGVWGLGSGVWGLGFNIEHSTFNAQHRMDRAGSGRGSLTRIARINTNGKLTVGIRDHSRNSCHVGPRVGFNIEHSTLNIE